MVTGVTLAECPPRWATEPGDRPNRLVEVRLLAELLGFQLMPWQEYVLSVITEHEDGVPWYKDVCVTVPRQCGKSEIVLGLMVLDRMLFWERQPQRIMWSAQKLNDGIAIIRDKLWPKLTGSKLTRDYSLRPAFALANPYLRSDRTGSSCSISGDSAKSGHGATLGLVVMDEAWAYKDSDREVALLPTMRAVEDPQWLIASTAGDTESLYLKQKVEAGRARVESGGSSRSAYFEWSVPDDADWQSPTVWRQAVPAYGWTVAEDTLRYEMEQASEADFRRNTLNQWVESRVEPVIPWEFYERAVSGKGAPVPPIVLGLDSNPRQDHIVLCAAGGGIVEFLKDWSNPGSIVDEVSTLVLSDPDVVGVAGCRRGPINRELELMERKGVRVFWYDTPRIAQGSVLLYDLMVRQQIVVTNSQAAGLRTSLAGATAAELTGGSWFWKSRPEAKVSLSPLMALTIGNHAAVQLREHGLPTVLRADEETIGVLQDEHEKAVVDLGDDKPPVLSPSERVERWRRIYSGELPDA